VVDPDDTNGSWKCKCDEVCQKSGSGWGNLENHVMKRHPNHVDEMVLAQEQGLWCPLKAFLIDRSQVLITSFMPRGATKIYGWLDWVISNLNPFSFVENPKNREYSKLDSTDHKTFKKYMLLLVKRVENKIKDQMDSKIGLMFLYINHDLWNLQDLIEIMRKNPNDDVDE
jgi:hypothetical protein